MVLPTADCLIIDIPGRFGDASQQGLCQRIDESKQSLLAECDSTDLSDDAVETSSEFLFAREQTATRPPRGDERLEREEPVTITSSEAIAREESILLDLDERSAQPERAFRNVEHLCQGVDDEPEG